MRESDVECGRSVSDPDVVSVAVPEMASPFTNVPFTPLAAAPPVMGRTASPTSAVASGVPSSVAWA